jgi:hypothetical protein
LVSLRDAGTGTFLGVAAVFSPRRRCDNHRAMTTTPPLSEFLSRAEVWRELARQLRVDSIRATAAAGSGHPTSAMSAADLIAVLVDKYLHYDFAHPDNPNNDHLIFSKSGTSTPQRA